ncbi:glucosamine-6-phosphate deaminase [Chitinispirillales bacterium ANBcel5]|uniref:glucosamine-6-phosphate deaminase n=1 Tax=Cellulosispirillum alkaliphilum TaxID=3039283 RepID=UPI002A554B5A|nr:glucosamine-6-phosphate deaminase [Chitinispirillales bacterium ANBcel5]
MEIIITSDYEDMSRVSAEYIAREIKNKHDLVLGLATGDTPIGTYKHLINLHNEEGLDFSKVKSFNLDEYVGLAPLHVNSYNYFMRENFFKHVNINQENVFVPQGHIDDPEQFSFWYESQIQKAGGIDLQVLGIGRDGHIGFNEPGSSFASRTRVKALYKQTIEDNARFFNHIDEVPRFAVTMGIGTILESRKILLIANGRSKADVVAQFIEGPVTSQVTASALQLHCYATVILDEDAASKLTRKEYYNWVRDNKHMVQKRVGR